MPIFGSIFRLAKKLKNICSHGHHLKSNFVSIFRPAKKIKTYLVLRAVAASADMVAAEHPYSGGCWRKHREVFFEV